MWKAEGHGKPRRLNLGFFQAPWRMARPIRMEFPGVVHHVISSGIVQAAIFLADVVRNSFLAILRQMLHRSHVLCHAYCLITNLGHLFLFPPSPGCQSHAQDRQCLRRDCNLSSSVATTRLCVKVVSCLVLNSKYFQIVIYVD